MFCKKCGKEIENGVKFCKSCGTPVENTETNIGAGTQNNLPVVLLIRIGVIGAGLLMAISTVLPYVVFGKDVARVSGIQSVSLLKAGDQIGDGIIYILIAAVAIVFACLRKKIPVLVCSVLSALMCWYEAHQFEKQYIEMLRGTNIDIWDYMDKGSGHHLLTVSVILLLVLAVLYFIMEKKGAKQ